jgi:hypothetical protein
MDRYFLGRDLMFARRSKQAKVYRFFFAFPLRIGYPDFATWEVA